MTVPWYEWRHIRNRLLSYGRALQGVSPYRTVLEPDERKCPTGSINFTKRLIMVNPTIFDVAEETQYQLTKAVLCHEAGHRRFTSPTQLPAHIHIVSNILEDERIERLMEQEFAGVRGLLRDLASYMLADTARLDPASDDPADILNCLLQVRWSERCGAPVKGSLSMKNQSLWAKVEPLAREAWSAESSAVSDENAHEIVKILGLSESDIPEWLKELLKKLSVIEGERTESDDAESASPDSTPLPEDEFEPTPFDGEIRPYEHGAGTTRHQVHPKPYLALLERVQPLISRLIEELSVDEQPALPEPAERGGRLSVRQYVRDRERPFVLPHEDDQSPPTLSVRVIIDHSGSMNFAGRIEKAAEAAMLVHLASTELEIAHQIVVTPDDIRIADLESGERGLALIAGIDPAQTGWENTGLAVSRHGAELAARSEDIKLLLVIHDGMGNDHEVLARECKRLRSQVMIFGIGLGMGETEAGLLKEQFGADRYLDCPSADELPEKVGAVIRTVRNL